MATVIPIANKMEEKKKLETVEMQWKYAFHTGLCPVCGRSLAVIHQCRKCKCIEASCTCGWGVLRD